MGNTYTEKAEFRGWPLFQIKYMDNNEEERTLISFGKKKAEAICDHIDEIRAFAEAKD